MDLIGLGRFVGGIAWIGLDWIGLGQMTANSLETEIFRLEAGLVKQTLKKLKYSQCV